MAMTTDIQIRPASVKDQQAINQVIEAAVMTWDIPDRVKRLSLNSYRYTETDFKFLNFIVAENPQHQLVGIAAWEPAEAADIPGKDKALLLHDIYVKPENHQKGIGSKLFQAIENIAKDNKFTAILVKAKTGADAFFIKNGMSKLVVEDETRQYANRYWKQL